MATGTLIPQAAWALPLWLLYAVVTGTVATGPWVIAHECGHGAFSDNKRLQDTVGYILHSMLLVPYFSWQRSHAVHHSRTNHIHEGETHVPPIADGSGGDGDNAIKLRRLLGSKVFAALHTVAYLGAGWPAYLLTGASGGPKYGMTNHFWPTAPFSSKLWPSIYPKKVWQSDIGILVMLGVLSAWAAKAGLMRVMSLYAAPLVFVNCWLVGYTWLQHTAPDVPHFDKENWSYMRGAFMTIDRPYGKVLDFLHHQIGSTHVAHHIDHAIPHYHAREATDAIAAKWPELYLYDPTPVHQALWQTAGKCAAVKQVPEKGVYLFTEE